MLKIFRLANGQIFQGERMTAALLDRLTHHCHIFEMNDESYRFKQSVLKSKLKKNKIVFVYLRLEDY